MRDRMINKEKSVVSKDALSVLLGYDAYATVYHDEKNNRILRKIAPEYRAQAQELYQLYKKYSLNACGIVHTEEYEASNSSYSLSHEKHCISYPHEWSASMLKEAALFHLHLLITLDEYGLTLKDALPNNILFDGSQPVFIDFLSLIKKEDLYRETWITKFTAAKGDYREVILQKMFIPYFVIPLLAMSRRRYDLARELLYARACNVSTTPPAWKDVTRLVDNRGAIRCLLETGKQQLFFKRLYRYTFLEQCKRLKHFIEKLNVAPLQGRYHNYYDEKGENYSFHETIAWKDKQRSVDVVLSNVKPNQVLDLGANTGWFSRLAAHRGARVIASDIDESCVDYMYCDAKKKQKKITPLYVSFQDLERRAYGFIPDDKRYLNRDFSKPLFLSALERYQSDVVLCLALIHHLVLGSGYCIDHVMRVLARLTNKKLILEFVSLKDAVIQNEPSFFNKLYLYDNTTYSVDVIIQTGLRYFDGIERLPSHPTTRELLVFKK